MNKKANKFIFTFSLVFVMIIGVIGADFTVYAAGGDTVVYITKTGKCYHSDGCSSLSKSKIETTLQKAVDKGYTACSKCKPPVLDANTDKTTDSKNADQKDNISKSKSSVSTSTSKKSSTDKATKSTQKSDKSTNVGAKSSNDDNSDKTGTTYVLNTSTKKFHKPSCKDVNKIKAENYARSTSDRDEIVGQGYSPCGHCNP